MALRSTSDVYYDPYDVEIDADPYPVYRRLREEAPLYYNEQHDFYAVSRFDDVERSLLDPKTFISGRGGIIELIRAGHRDALGGAHLRGPAGPHHAPAAALAGLHPQPGGGARTQDPGVLRPQPRPARRRRPSFDFIADLGAQMPMRVIGMLLGIPEEDQEAVRDQRRRATCAPRRASRCR